MTKKKINILKFKIFYLQKIFLRKRKNIFDLKRLNDLRFLFDGKFRKKNKSYSQRIKGDSIFLIFNGFTEQKNGLAMWKSIL